MSAVETRIQDAQMGEVQQNVSPAASSVPSKDIDEAGKRGMGANCHSVNGSTGFQVGGQRVSSAQDTRSTALPTSGNSALPDVDTKPFPISPVQATEDVLGHESPSVTGTDNHSAHASNNVEADREQPKVEDSPKYIQPDHFSPLNNNPNGGALTRGIPNIGDGWLSPEDDPQALRGIPVFKPTLEEFQDFEGYARKTTAWGQYSGIVKIIPPSDWVSSVPPIPKSAISDIQITDPIQQNLIGSSGLFRIANVVRNRRHPLTVQEWFKKSRDKKHIGLGPKDLDRTMNRDSREAIEQREKIKEEMRREKEKRREKRKLADETKAKKAEQAVNEANREEEEIAGTGSVKGQTPHDIETTIPSAPETESHHAPSPNSPKENSDDPWYETFDPTEDWLPENTRPEDYTPEACAALERRFWKNMGLGEPSWYGADMEGTLFVDKNTPWNVAHLPNLLNRWDLRHLPGVNAPYLYFGMWGASFAWHVEDMDLFSINYIHFGAPKFWYAIPQAQAERFERVLQGYFPEEARNCSQFLRHKAFAVSPYRLASEGVHVNMLVHNQGEFVITYPRGYHAGYNMGFNCAESVNFALESWVELGRRAKACNCVNHSVRIDVDEMLAKEASQFAGEQELLAAIETERKRKPKKRTPADENTPRKKHKPASIAVAANDLTGPVPVSAGISSASKSQRKRAPKTIVDISSPNPISGPEPDRDIRHCPCLFCPAIGTEDLLPVFDPSNKVKDRWKPRNGKATVHHSCALAMPGVGIEDILVGEQWGTFVVGAENVENARWKLKCLLCSDKNLGKMGAKIQCTKGKCPRAFHVSCARTSDTTTLKIWEVETPQLPQGGEAPLPEGAEIPVVRDIKVELLCPQHNPEMKERLEQKKREEFRDRVMSIPIGSKLKIKMRTGASVEYSLVEAREGTQQIYVQDDQGVGGLFSWSSIDFRESQGKLMENEYARVHTHSRRSDVPTVPEPVHLRPLRMDEILNPSPAEHTEVPPERRTSLPQPNRASQTVAIAKNHMRDGDRSRQIPTPMSYSSNIAYQQQSRAPPNAHASSYPPLYDPRAYSLPSYGHAYPKNEHEVYRRYSAPHPAVPKPEAWQTGPPPLGGAAFYPGYALGPPVSHTSQGNSWLAPGNEPSSINTSRSGNSSGSRAAPPKPSSDNGLGAIDLGLSRMKIIMSSFLPLSVPAIHLAGTNGKGSVSALLESCLLAAGLNVARYNSPHLIEPRDAIRINGLPPSEEGYEHAVNLVKNLNGKSKLGATSFEIATASAYWLINNAEPKIDVMIIECGLGGARDATNVIPHEKTLASALTSVGLDHTTFLGNTVQEIAQEKAKIAAKDALFVIGRQTYKEVIPLAKKTAEERGARVIEALPTEAMSGSLPPMSFAPFRRPPPVPVNTYLPPIPHHPNPSVLSTHLSLPGRHQMDNLSVAISILHGIRHDPRAKQILPELVRLTDEVLQRGVLKCHWEGRCSWLEWKEGSRSWPILVDGAHNADSASALRKYIDTLVIQGPRPPLRFIISLSASPGKSIESVLSPLLRLGDQVEIVEFTTPVQGMPWINAVVPGEAAAVAARILGNHAVRVGGRGVEGVKQALRSARDEGRMVVACGSLYLVADVYRMLGE